MAKCVILNLAEETGTGTGVTKKVEEAVLAHGKEKKVTRPLFVFKKTTIIQNNEVKKYDLVEIFDRKKVGKHFGLAQELINEIKLACGKADRVYLCAHGSATDRNQVYTQRGEVGKSKVEMLATVGEFADFACLVLDTSKVHDLRLIVCFAARSDNADVVHTEKFLSNGKNNYQALKSSLAYKLFSTLDGKNVKTKMAARLGEVRVSAAEGFAMTILTQTEEGVVAGINLKQAIDEEQKMGRKLKPGREIYLRNYVTLSDQKLPITVPECKPLDDDETKYVEAYRQFCKLNREKEKQALQSAKGRLIYEKQGGNLVISFEGRKIYEGGLF